MKLTFENNSVLRWNESGKRNSISKMYIFESANTLEYLKRTWTNEKISPIL